jgi:hypothetical protein
MVGGSSSSGGSDSGDDSAMTVIFGDLCPTGTTYADPLTSNPLMDGSLVSLAGTSTYDPAGHTLSLTTGNPNTQLWIGPRPSWTNYTVSVPIRLDTPSANAGLNFRIEIASVGLPNDGGQMYFAGLEPGDAQLGTEQQGTYNQRATGAGNFQMGTFYTLAVSVSGSTINVSVDGAPYITNFTDTTFAYGSFGPRTFNSGATFGAMVVTCQ